MPTAPRVATRDEVPLLDLTPLNEGRPLAGLAREFGARARRSDSSTRAITAYRARSSTACSAPPAATSRCPRPSASS